MTEFRWVEWNVEHATKHGVTIVEIESVVRNAKRPYPKKIGHGKWAVVGRGNGGRFIRVIFALDPEMTTFVIHAMPINPRRPKRGRR